MTSLDSPSRPAVLGGVPVRPAGPPGWPLPDDDVHRALDAAYHSGAWGKYDGPHVPELEHRLAHRHGVRFAAACSSGTFAVELALRALRVAAGDEVLLAAYDFPGNFRSVLAVGARPVLVDVHPRNWNLDPDALEAAIGPATRAVIVSHLHGGFVPMRRMMEIARRHGVAVVEDAAQAPGARVEGRAAGSWGDAGTLSFGGSKLLTAGRGGAIVTDRKEVHHRARLVCERGNHAFPLSELQAAVLLPQLDKLDARNRLRSENAAHLKDALRDLPGLRPLENSDADSAAAYYKLGFQYDPARFGGVSRDRFVEAARAEGIAFDAGFRALHTGRSRTRYRSAGPLAEAERAHHGMVVLHHPILLGSHDDIDEIAHAVRKLYVHRDALRA